MLRQRPGRTGAGCRASIFHSRIRAILCRRCTANTRVPERRATTALQRYKSALQRSWQPLPAVVPSAGPTHAFTPNIINTPAFWYGWCGQSSNYSETECRTLRGCLGQLFRDHEHRFGEVQTTIAVRTTAKELDPGHLPSSDETKETDQSHVMHCCGTHGLASPAFDFHHWSTAHHHQNITTTAPVPVSACQRKLHVPLPLCQQHI